MFTLILTIISLYGHQPSVIVVVPGFKDKAHCEQAAAQWRQAIGNKAGSHMAYTATCVLQA